MIRRITSTVAALSLLAGGLIATPAVGASPSPDEERVHAFGAVAVPYASHIDLDEGRLMAGRDEVAKADLLVSGPPPPTDAEPDPHGEPFAWPGHALPNALVIGGFDPVGLEEGIGRPYVGRQVCTDALDVAAPVEGPQPEPVEILESAFADGAHLCVRTDLGRVSEIWFMRRPDPLNDPLWPDDGYWLFAFITWDAD